MAKTKLNDFVGLFDRSYSTGMFTCHALKQSYGKHYTSLRSFRDYSYGIDQNEFHSMR